jgi:hypothetical protein
VNTINQIINVWAPDNTEEKNHTKAYIKYAAEKMQLSPHEYISPAMLPEMMLHMSKFEGDNIGYYTIEQAVQGAALAKQESFVIARLHRMGETSEMYT